MDSKQRSKAFQAGWHDVSDMPAVPPLCRAFQKTLADGHLSVLVGREPFGKNGEEGWHLSISHRKNVLSARGLPQPGRIPTFAELKEARDLFTPDDVYMAQIFPPAAEYVNVHETTLHLWEIPKDVAR